MTKKASEPQIHLRGINFKSHKPALSDNLKNLEIKIDLKNMDFQKINENNVYEGVMGVSLWGVNHESKETIFEVHVSYSVIIELTGFNEDELMSIFHINLSNFTYPYIRADISRVVSDSGFPRVSLPLVDFAKIYQDKYKKT